MTCSLAAGHPAAKSTRILLGFLLFYTSWAWAGLRPSFHWVGVAASALLLAGLFRGGNAPSRRALWRDPVFSLGLSFLGFLALQWVNAGRELYFDVGYHQWRYTPPPWPGWPSAFSRPDALQMLAWFFPAWVIAVTLRSGILCRRELRRLLLFVVFQAGLLAGFGLVQFASATRSIYWMQPMNEKFFASFAYGNHVAPYFVLVGAVAVGLLYREVFDFRRPYSTTSPRFKLRHPGRVAALIPALLLCLVGANLGISRAGVILTAGLVVFAVGYGLLLGWRTLPPAGRINFAALALSCAGMLYFAVAGFGEKAIRKEFGWKVAGTETVQTAWDRIGVELDGRPWFAKAAIQIWKEHPWFGVGGWGYKYLVAGHVPERFWGSLEKRGWANVHFDLLQFLAEFGLVGFGLLACAGGVMARDLFCCRDARGSLWIMGVAGLGLVGVFSVIDLPFRCPAILYVWVAVLAALPRICREHPDLAFHEAAVSERHLAWRSSPVQIAFPERTCP